MFMSVQKKIFSQGGEIYPIYKVGDNIRSQKVSSFLGSFSRLIASDPPTPPFSFTSVADYWSNLKTWSACYIPKILETDLFFEYFEHVTFWGSISCLITPTHFHHLLLSDISTTPELRTLDVGRPQINVNVRKIPHWSDLIATTQRSTPTQKKSP